MTIRFALPIALLLVSASARAQAEPAAAGGSYRWQIAATDAALVSTAVAGFSLEGRDGALNYIPSNTLMTVGGVGYFLGAPIVHVAHKEYGRAGVSLALRVGLPLVGAAIGARMATCTPNEILCGLEEMGKGFLVGAVTAVVLDSVVVTPGSTSEAEPERVPTAARAPAGLQVAPQLVATPNVAMVGLGGRF